MHLRATTNQIIQREHVGVLRMTAKGAKKRCKVRVWKTNTFHFKFHISKL